MKEIRKFHRDNMLVCGIEFLYDSELSFASKGLLAILLSYPEKEAISIDEIACFGRHGMEGLLRAWGELRKFGYLREEESDVVLVFDFRV